MNQLDRNIATNLKRIRKSKNMSLDMLAEKTGVSKSMLGQIERGESNPTVATIAKIVEGIRVSFEELIYAQEQQIEVIDHNTIPALKREDGSYEIKSLFPYEKSRDFEVYEIEIEPGESCEDFLQTDGVCEYIMISEGVLTLKAEGDFYEIDERHSVKMNGMSHHRFYNKGNKKLKLQVVVSFQKQAE